MSGVVYDETQAVKRRKSVISNLNEDDESEEGQGEKIVSQTNSHNNQRVGNKRVRRKRN